MVHQLQFALTAILVLALVGGSLWALLRTRGSSRVTRRDLLLLAVVLVVALAIRLSATVFVSNHQLDSAQGVDIGHAHRWAAGFSCILHALFLVFPSSVATAASFNVVVSVATVGVLFVFVDVYFRDRLAAFAAAAFLSLQPISARYAHSDSAAVLLTFCLVAGLLFLAQRVRGGDHRLLVLGAGWLALAANVRYEGVVYAAAGGAIVLGAGGWPDRPMRRELLRGALFGAVFLAYPIYRALADASQGVSELSPMGYLGVFVLSNHSPVALVVLGFAGLAAVTLTQFRAALGVLLALIVVSLPGFFVDRECADLSNRYALPHLALWAALTGCGFSAVWSVGARLLARLRRGPNTPSTEPGPAPVAPAAQRLPVAASLAALTLALVAALPHRSFLTKMWTFSLEHQFIAAHLRNIPDECLLIGPDSGWEIRGLRIWDQLSWDVGRQHRWTTVDSPEVLAGQIAPCTVYYQATACYGFESMLKPVAPDFTGDERPTCRRMAELFDLEPIATTTIPSIGYACEEHTVDPVPAGFYRVRLRSATANGPRE